ncbi:hypothetical protein [Georgenia muralis]|uniref:Uncharacterized protein n=1 Tax=Georgenia muralis TaxID=154117 RepID=A0A3N4ZA82_9MICO|nr:hypothetical protein [Georgenia muralis]RPF28984.1 hypothetical protein EDD32_3535 [Georgenia muralis]
MEDIEVRAVAAVRTDGSAVVGLGEDESGAGTHLIVSRLLSPDGSAATSEPYTLSTETGATCEGGVREIVADGVTLTIRVSDGAAETLGIPVERRYRFSDATVAARIHKALAWLVDPARSTVPDDLFDRP